MSYNFDIEKRVIHVIASVLNSQVSIYDTELLDYQSGQLHNIFFFNLSHKHKFGLTTVIKLKR